MPAPIKPEDPREVALQILCRQESKDFTLSQFPKPPKFHDPRNRALFRELLQGVTRNRSLLDWYLGKLSKKPLVELDPEVLNTLRLGLYQILFLDQIPHHAAVNEAVNLIARAGRKSAKGFVNAALRNFLRNPLSPPAKEDLATRFSFPKTLIHNFEGVLQWSEGNHARLEYLLQALNQPLPICIRVNRLKTSREDLAKRLGGFDPHLRITPTPYSPDGLTLEGSEDLTHLPGYHAGEFFVQSESSQLIARLLGPFDQPLQILDACAAPGGKTTHLAELQQDRGRIIALAAPRTPAKQGEDKSFKRLNENIARLQLQSIEVLEETAEDYAKSLPQETFDRILIDAPCTGLGTIAKHPERKWHFKEKYIEKLAKQQQSILAAVLPLLKKDGILVYSVCSLTLAEWQVGLKLNPLLDPPKEDLIDWQSLYYPHQKCFLFWPDQMKSEGLFAVRMGNAC